MANKSVGFDRGEHPALSRADVHVVSATPTAAEALRKLVLALLPNSAEVDCKNPYFHVR